jgi:hypothetical protein
MPCLMVYMGQGSFLHCQFISIQKPLVPFLYQWQLNASHIELILIQCCFCRHQLPILHLNEQFILSPMSWRSIGFFVLASMV